MIITIPIKSNRQSGLSTLRAIIKEYKKDIEWIPKNEIRSKKIRYIINKLI